MLVRDLDWKPREKGRLFDLASVKLADGRVMYLERGVRRPDYFALTIGPVEGDDSIPPWSRRNPYLRELSTEFELQAVFDYYIETFGLENNHTMKPLDDTGVT